MADKPRETGNRLLVSQGFRCKWIYASVPVGTAFGPDIPGDSCSKGTAKMKRYPRLHVALIALAAAALGLAISTTSAGAAPYTNQMTVGVSDSTPNPGQTITVSGSGATPNGQVSIDFHSAPVHLATVTANASGDFSASVTIPSGCGPHSISATDVTTGNSASTSVTLPACAAAGGTSSGGGGLSSTGVAVASIGGVGVVLLLGGGLMLLLGRRRRATV